MDKNISDLVDTNAKRLNSDKYALIHNGKMVILEKINVYGSGYRVITSFTFDEFEILKKLSADNMKGF